MTNFFEEADSEENNKGRNTSPSKPDFYTMIHQEIAKFLGKSYGESSHNGTSEKVD
ncbi:hypothetical protein ACS0TY_013301 [Phlomoides rotata]